MVVNAADKLVLQKIALIDRATLICNKLNLGLATALNFGMSHAFVVLDSDMVALFDQDSLLTADLVEGLAHEFSSLQSQNLACLGLSLVDIKAEKSAYIKSNYQSDLSHPRSLPTSGSVISRHAFNEVGPMKDSLFIDGIDHKWCFRAYSKKFVIKVSGQWKMAYNMGDVGVNIFRWYKPIHQSTNRHYYIIRNAIHLIKLSYIPIFWSLGEFFKTIRRAIIYLLVSTNRLLTVRLISLALVDGMRGKLGALNQLHPNA